MRLAAQAKSGYYPLALEVVRLIGSKLATPEGGTWTLVDPCCGEGVALRELADLTSCQVVYGAELDERRVEAARQLIPSAKIEGPCDFLSMKTSSRWASCVYVNPPFDTDGMGGRLETRFIREARNLLAPGGVMAAVVPETALANDDLFDTVVNSFKDVVLLAAPEQHRPFKEVVIFGVRRASALSDTKAVTLLRTRYDWESIPDGNYQIPNGAAPVHWKKNALTPEELAEYARKSPLHRLFTEVPEWHVARPPMSLGKGHTALLLAAGHLDGVVERDGVRHVVRGVTRKEQFVKSVEDQERPDGGVTTVTVMSERMKPVVRTAWQDGRILTHE